ncbi:MAG: 3'-5' exonuclease, partial [Bacteroidales bacterium]
GEFCSMREESGEGASITDFISEVSLASDQDGNDDSESDKVTMMTVHSAKGLEYPNVFVVGLEEDLFPSAMCKNSVQEIEEERRLLYVAITRAQKCCILTYSATRYRNGQTVSSPPSRFINDLDPRYIDDQGSVVRSERVSRTEARTLISPVRTGYADVGVAPERENRSLRRTTLTPVNVALSGLSKTMSTKENCDVVAGSVICHERFGEGTVIAVSGEGDNCKIDVEFNNVGKKSLLLKFAKFKII